MNNQQHISELIRLDKIIADLSKDDLLSIVDQGHFNDVIRGYLIDAMQRADFDHDKIGAALNALHASFDAVTAAEAQEKFAQFE